MKRPANGITERRKAGPMHWEGEGRLMVLVDGFDYRRAILMSECGSWLMIGPLGTAMPIKEQAGSNKRVLMRAMEKLLRELGY